MKPLLSILIPVYGVEKYIERCARSLFEQTYENIEFIFVNDSTKDNSIAVLEYTIKDYPNRRNTIQIIHHEHNKGLSSARNTAIDTAKGEYLMHMDSDDFLTSPQAVDKLMLPFIQEDADMVLFDLMYIYPNHQYVCKQIVSQNKLKYLSDVILRKTAVCVCGGIYKANLYKEFHIRHIDGLDFGEDYVVKPRLIYYADKIVHVAEPYYGYIQFNNNSITARFNVKHVDDISKVIDVLTDFFSKVSDGHKYLSYIENVTLKLKAELLAKWGASYKASKSDFNKIMYIENKISINSAHLNFTDKMNLYIAKYCRSYIYRLIQKIYHSRHL